MFTLSSVPHTPLGRFNSARDARAVLDRVDTALVTDKARLMEEQIKRYIPAFSDTFRFVGPQLAMKTKPLGSFDDRSCYVYQNGRIFSVMSGKIDTIFFATERILSMLEAAGEDEAVGKESSSLRAEIVNVDRLPAAV